jgi:hypothetical protein
MNGLLLEKDLRESKEDSEVRTLARARTLTVLSRLDPSRKTAVMLFLVEAGLVQRIEEQRSPIINLLGAKLNGADLSTTNLNGAELSHANLNFADLSYADLNEGANLLEADLSNAELRYSELRGAELSNANLSEADLSDAILEDADLSGANLSEADLSRAVLTKGADLFEADLSEADLSDSALIGAELSGANLSGANLDGADLDNAKGITNEEVEQQASSLKGATMPGGQLQLPTGKYVAYVFKPALSFRVNDDWQLWRDTRDELFLEGSQGGQLIFTRPSRVFDPSSLSEPNMVPAPESADEWASWFQKHPNLDTSEPVPVSMSGASGLRIDVTLSSTPENYSRALCGEQPCVPLTGTGIVSTKGWKDHFIIVDVDGEPVVIDVSAASADEFDEFLPKAQEVLDTVEWESE